MESRDILALTELRDPTLASGGDLAAWVRRSVDVDANAYRDVIEIAPLDGTGVRTCSAGPADASPRFSPDASRLAFLRRPEPGSPEALVVSRSDGSAVRPLLALPHGAAGAPAWSADGRRVALLAWVDPGRGLDGPALPGDELRRRTADVTLTARLPFKRDGVGYVGALRCQVVIVDLDDAGAPAGAHLAPGGDRDVYDFDWHPAEQRLALVAPTSEGDRPLDHDCALRLYDAVTGDMTEIGRLAGGMEAPAWSPDGTVVAVLGSDDRVGSSTHTRLWVFDAAGSQGRCLTADFDRSLRNLASADPACGAATVKPAWTADGDAVYVVASDRGSTAVWRVNVADGATTRSTAAGQVIGDVAFDPAARRCLVLRTDAGRPPELVLTRVGDAGLEAPEVVAAPNRELLADRSLSRPRELLLSRDGVQVQGWLLPPTDGEARTGWPLLLSIHGGPVDMYGHAFSHELQTYAAHGFAVLHLNPRGSGGYGESFAEAIAGRWGTVDAADLLAMLDHALETYPCVDRERVGVIGGSYGGWMVNWLIAHAPERFRAAVSERGISNMYSEFSTCEDGYLAWMRNHGGTPWERPEAYLAETLLPHLTSAAPPTLILHAGRDQACPIEQAEQLYVALKLAGAETLLAVFEEESHMLRWSGRPWHRVRRIELILEWFRRHLA